MSIYRTCYVLSDKHKQFTIFSLSWNKININCDTKICLGLHNDKKLKLREFSDLHLIVMRMTIFTNTNCEVYKNVTSGTVTMTMLCVAINKTSFYTISYETVALNQQCSQAETGKRELSWRIVEHKLF